MLETKTTGRLACGLRFIGLFTGLFTSLITGLLARLAPAMAQEAAGVPAPRAEPAVSIQKTLPHRTPCKPRFVWREAYPGDPVCVSPRRRGEVAEENRLGPSRVQPGGGPYGPATCQAGYVWREAREGDVVCVEPRLRDLAAAENRNARYTQAGGPKDCDSAAHCARVAQHKRREAEDLRRRIAARQKQLQKAEADQRRAMEQLRRKDEEWMRQNPGLGRTTQPSVADNVTPLRRDIDEMERALREAEQEAARAEAESKRQ